MYKDYIDSTVVGDKRIRGNIPRDIPAQESRFDTRSIGLLIRWQRADGCEGTLWDLKHAEEKRRENQ